MATGTTMAKQLSDITQCSICSDPFTDPRSLPCVHTYCLKCIERSADGRKPGENVPCPLCRKEFTVPVGGILGLPKNFFIEKMLSMKQLTSDQCIPSACEACDTDKTGVSENAPATAFCVDCQEKLCEECAKYHKKYKMARTHRIVKLDESGRLQSEDILSKSVLSGCEKHEDQTLAIFCQDCKVAICVVCYVSTHKQHDCSDIKDVVEKIQMQMTTDAGSLEEGIGKLKDWLLSLEESREGFSNRVTVTKEEILRNSEAMKQLIEKNTKTLLDELEIGHDQVVKKLDHLTQEMTQQISLMENLKKYTEELCNKGTHGDIALGTSSLRNRTDEMLLNVDSIRRMRDDMDHIDVKFMASALLEEDNGNVVGKVDLYDCKPCAPKLSHTLPSTGYNVSGVTSLANQLFVVRYRQQHIEVYDTTTFVLQRNIQVNGLHYAYGLASCSTKKCLYASNYNGNSVFRVDLASSGVNSWETGAYPVGLYVNDDTNVLVSCYQSLQLEEYTGQGTLVRRINLQSLYPWNAIQIKPDEFVVSHSTGVCVVDANGQVKRSEDGTTNRSVQLNNPAGLLQVRSGCILVANRYSHTLVLLNPSLSGTQEFPLPVDMGLLYPWGLWLDEACGRLYVCEYDGGLRVHVCDDVFNVGSGFE